MRNYSPIMGRGIPSQRIAWSNRGKGQQPLANGTEIACCSDDQVKRGEAVVPKRRVLNSQLYERLFHAFSVGLAVVDREMVVQYSNRNFTKLFAVKGSALGRSITKFLPSSEIENLIGSNGAKGKCKEAELQVSLPRRGKAFFKTTVIPFTLNGDSDSLFLVSLEDVTDRLRMEEQLLQAEKLSAMGHMAASLVHEIGNPLSIMITSLEILRHSLQNSNGELKEQVEIMAENSVRMHELLTSLTDMSSLGKFQMKKIDLRGAINSVLCFVSKMAEKSGITIKTELMSDLPPCRVDERKLKQIFLNLFKNAMEAMSDGGTLTVRCRYCPSLPLFADTQTAGVLAEEGSVMVEVEDTGKGVPCGELETIFKPFYSTKKRGMGLGLSLCRGIIEKHGGKILVTSQEGKGSRFTVEIPIDCAL
ncbi:MAG: ATP-binding protein [Deltaproteobacteria bacterium]|nr:ATP-binding protein [Deltaproteobacteria bacterium]